MRDVPTLAPSAPSKLEQARMKLWDMPAPTTREQFLERKDVRHEIDVMEKDEYMKLHKPGYQNLMKLRGVPRGDIDNGM